MRILDVNGKEVCPGDRVVFTLNGDVYEGRITSFKGKYAPTAKISYTVSRNGVTYRTSVAALKLVRAACRRQVREIDGEEFFQTYRLRLLSGTQDHQDASENSVQGETQAAGKNSRKSTRSKCLACGGSGVKPIETMSSLPISQCHFCEGTGLFEMPPECPGGHDSLYETLGCRKCTKAFDTLLSYRIATRRVYGRGSPESPCEYCGATEGNTIDSRGFQRCNSCGEPGQ